MINSSSLFAAAAKKSVAAVPDEKAESPTQQAPKDPDERIIIESHENGIRALASIVSPTTTVALMTFHTRFNNIKKEIHVIQNKMKTRLKSQFTLCL